MALISVILPPRGTDTTAEPQHCEPWAATMDSEVLWMAALGQKGFLLGAYWGGRLCGVGGLGLALGESHKPTAESFLGVVPLSPGSLSSPPPVASESGKSVSPLLCCGSGVALCSVSAARLLLVFSPGPHAHGPEWPHSR